MLNQLNRLMSHEHDKQPSAPLTLEAVIRRSKEHLQKHGTHLPMILIEGEQQSIAIGVGDMPNTASMRVRHLFVVGYAAAQQEAMPKHLNQLFFITEGWMSVSDDGTLPNAPPSEDPSRREVLLFHHLQLPDLQSQVATVEIFRDEQGQIIRLDEVAAQVHSDQQIQSPLLPAFAAGYQLGISGATEAGKDTKN